MSALETLFPELQVTQPSPLEQARRELEKARADRELLDNDDEGLALLAYDSEVSRRLKSATAKVATLESELLRKEK